MRCAPLIAATLTLAATAAAADIYVRPYVRSDGVHVRGHYRTAPNDDRFDNYSAAGRVNPHTGAVGPARDDGPSLPSLLREFLDAAGGAVSRNRDRSPDR